MAHKNGDEELTSESLDHSGGNQKLIKAVSLIDRVYGSNRDGVTGCTHKVGHGDSFLLGKKTEVKVLFTPCHTQGHVC